MQRLSRTKMFSGLFWVCKYYGTSHDFRSIFLCKRGSATSLSRLIKHPCGGAACFSPFSIMSHLTTLFFPLSFFSALFILAYSTYLIYCWSSFRFFKLWFLVHLKLPVSSFRDICSLGPSCLPPIFSRCVCRLFLWGAPRVCFPPYCVI